jgi:polyisoprenyl-teichoic acid--peptidoglycan teichoic acid transferase
VRFRSLLPVVIILGVVALSALLLNTVVGFDAFLHGSTPDRIVTPGSTAVAAAHDVQTGVADPATETHTPGSTVPPTHTPHGTSTPSGPPSTPTPPFTATPSRTPTMTLTPSATPTSRPQQEPTMPPLITLDPDLLIATPATAIPTPVPTFGAPSGVTNVLLMGRDTPLDSGRGRTDTMIVVSVNRNNQTASMISLPRDLYVYLPGRGMDRINAAMARGGPDLMKSTILYNFGVPIHFYAQVDFSGFKEIVDIIGGVELAVSCRLTDWRLISPELDPNLEESWARYTLEPGIHQMDGDLALWYARSRLTTSDFDRGRRQQQLLRAILNRGVDRDLITQVPTLYNAFQNMVETDMDIGRMLQLAAIAPAVRQNGIQHLYLAGKTESWTVPVAEGMVAPSVQLPIWEGANMMEETFRRLFLPPAINRANRPPILVEIINTTGSHELALLAADNLAWYGFVPIISGSETEPAATSSIQYYAQNFKGSFERAMISWIFRKRASEVELVPDVVSNFNYRVILGADYNPCLPAFYAPQADLEP